jgi:uncharacterized membrane protein YidH (DUF202 family)
MSSPASRSGTPPPDEITPIIPSELGARANYNTAADQTSTSAQQLKDGGPALAPGAPAPTAPAPSSPRRRASAASQRGRLAWLRELVDKHGAVELDNKGSVARDHLALGNVEAKGNSVHFCPILPAGPRPPLRPPQYHVHLRPPSPPPGARPWGTLDSLADFPQPAERTFLAWLRTSLAFASIGIAITQLFRLNTTLQGGGGGGSSPSAAGISLQYVGRPLGAVFLVIAIITLFAGFRRYFESQVRGPAGARAVARGEGGGLTRGSTGSSAASSRPAGGRCS